MKRKLSCFLLVLCIILSIVSLTACSGGTKYLRPNFTYEGEELTIEFVTNMEKDIDFPIEGVKFNHSKFADEKLFEYGWIIYNSDREIVGWIEAGNGYETDKSGDYLFGWNAYYIGENVTSTSYIKDAEYGYWNADFCLVLKSKDFAIFDNIEFTSDYGSVIKTDMDNNPFPSADRYEQKYNAETNMYEPAEGSENFVCCFYSVKGIDPNDTQNISITLSFKSE